MKSFTILITKPSVEYSLLDSGEGEKLEKFGPIILARPDPQALWHKRLPEADWKKAVGHFERSGNDGKWIFKNGRPDRWPIGLSGLIFWVKPSSFKHVGIFPEQSENWMWLESIVKKGKMEVLNLFGYTGGATLACAKAGANVVHVDSSKTAMTWARENAELSGLKNKPIRWILDDARDFVRRELKRGRKYDGIIMDPPTFGHGPDSELWKIEEHFLPLVDQCIQLLNEKPKFFLINGYSAGYSSIAYENILMPLTRKFGGTIEVGELAIEEIENKLVGVSRLLPAGIFARWRG